MPQKLVKNVTMKLLAGAMALVATCGAASAFTDILTMPTAVNARTSVAVYHEGVDAPKVDHVWWCRWGCGRGWGYRPWGWGAPAVAAGVATGVVAGAVVGSAIAAPAYPYGPGYCWRRDWWGRPYRVC